MSHSEAHRISKAFLASLTEGVVELTSDWKAQHFPSLSLEGALGGDLELYHLPASEYAKESRYFVDGDGSVVFVLDPEEYSYHDYEKAAVYVAGSFNGWEQCVGVEKWRMTWGDFDGKRVLLLRCQIESLEDGRRILFKFVSEEHHWFAIDSEAPNAVFDSMGNANYQFSEKLSGRHRLGFSLPEPVDLSENLNVIYHGRSRQQKIPLSPGPFFFRLRSDKPLGALVAGETTTFRLFAPRAKWVKLGIFFPGDAVEDIDWVLMAKAEDFVWEAAVEKNLAGAYYWYRLDGPRSPYGLFDPDFKILDPYAKAAVSREGPGIVVDENACGSAPRFSPEPWQDLVVLEAHVRDLVAGLPENRECARSLGFADLQAYVESERFYPKSLGVNALELQPVQENDSQSYEEYHWGYMTANYFSPASSYATTPERGSQVAEFRSLVSSIHDQGMAVILDVVYNHVGEPAHLMYIDKLYYFHLGLDGSPVNWSGCGNDFRCDAPMAKRIIIDSLKHFATFYGVDGFRFDLADLVGKTVLQDIETELKAVKPDVILIAEPWSFRGHIGRELRDTGFASWNDGYRESVKSYVRGEASPQGLVYYLKGSEEHYAYWPAQTVNYTESHDDRVWIDNITENPGHHGMHPTLVDIRRTHMMAAIMMMSIGIPMLHAGQDFLFSKRGANNTYQRGVLNALDYERRREYSMTSDYFRSWVAFRRSELGRLMRHYSRAGEGFFEELMPEGRKAVALLYNADFSQGPQRLLFAVNPEFEPLRVPLGNGSGSWRQLADHARFWGSDDASLRHDLSDELILPPLSCGLWVSERA